MRFSRLCLSVLPTLGAACALKPASGQGAAGLDSVVLERTPCLGTCPAYRLVIARGGLVHFQSRERGDTAFHAREMVAPGVLDTIASRAEQTGFYDLPDDIWKDPILCKDRATDHPTIIVGLFGQRSKRVVYYTGCYAQCCEHSRAALLANLDRLAMAIDSMTQSSRWAAERTREVMATARATRLARRRDAIMAAPRCLTLPLLDTGAWVEALPGDTTMGLRLPREFTGDPTFRPSHGRARWIAGDRAVVLQTLFWDPASELNPNAGSCRVTVAAGDYIVDERDGYEWSAMPADTTDRITMRVGLRSPRREDRSLFLTVLATLSLRR